MPDEPGLVTSLYEERCLEGDDIILSARLRSFGPDPFASKLRTYANKHVASPRLGESIGTALAS